MTTAVARADRQAHTIRFSTSYFTSWGERVVVVGSHPVLVRGPGSRRVAGLLTRERERERERERGRCRARAGTPFVVTFRWVALSSPARPPSDMKNGGEYNYNNSTHTFAN